MMMMTMVRMRMRMRMRVRRMQQIQLFFLVLELKHVGGFSQDQQVGDHSLSSFVPLQDKQTNKQRDIQQTKGTVWITFRGKHRTLL